MEGVVALPHLGGGEADFPWLGAGLSRVEEDLPQTEKALSWVSTRVLLLIKTKGQPSGCRTGELALLGMCQQGVLLLLVQVGNLEIGLSPRLYVSCLPGRWGTGWQC